MIDFDDVTKENIKVPDHTYIILIFVGPGSEKLN